MYEEFDKDAVDENGIKSFDMTPSEGVVDHDAIVIDQAGKLMRIGYLEYEIAVYATAVYQDGNIYYYMSAKEDSAQDFVRQCYLKNLYPTPIRYYYKRYDLLHSTEEEVKQIFRMEIAERLQKAYPPEYFATITELTKPLVSDSALPIMKELSGQLENCFDLSHLNIYENLLEMMLPSRLISVAGYQLMHQWLDKEYEKLSIEPVKAGAYERTYAGFAYLREDGTLKYFIDAFTYMTHEKQNTFLSQGKIVTPILTRTYSAKSFQHMVNIRDNFRTDIAKYLNKEYIRFMQLLRTLPSTVNKALFDEHLQKLKSMGATQAVEALNYYGYLWNTLQ